MLGRLRHNQNFNDAHLCDQAGGRGHSRQLLNRVADGNDFTIVGPPHLEEWRSRSSATGFALQEHQDPSAFFSTSFEVV